ncbi:MAG: NADH:flavin oxidoreductase/NADH oxidase [Betaproteobacteria bacterium]|nr:NADH:flavin oxidoreductase/NADH oxidase [Betaproteobacteria bacterium]
MDAKPANPHSARGENERKVFQRDRTPHIFRPIEFRSVRVRNRITMSPMCQYSAENGVAGDWHFQHLCSRAVGGAGIVFTESVAIEPRGLITSHCLGLWNDEQRDAYARITKFVKEAGAVPAIQLSHSGRKGAVGRPWEGGKPLTKEQGAWPLIAPSALAFGDGYQVPTAMDADTIAKTIELYAIAARRAREAGFQLIEVHAAHGYIAHEFLSPLANQRTDRYGGSFENRTRFLLEAIAAVRSEWPDDMPLFVRISATDWVEGGWDLESSVQLAQALKATGKVDLIDCSSGGLVQKQKPVIHPGYQVPFAAAVRSRAGIATSAVGMIYSPDMAEQIVANGQADMVSLGRAMLIDPYWPQRAAKVLRAEVNWPAQYERGDIY